MNHSPDIRIFVVCHKPTPLPDEDGFVPIQVGNGQDIPGISVRDNTGDNIASKNANYCELTAQYWIWKNVKADYVGLCHYRRIPSFTRCRDGAFHDFSEATKRRFGWTKRRIARLLEHHDILLSPNWPIFPPGEPWNLMTPYAFHSCEHRQSDIDETLRVIHDLTPEMDRYAHKALCEDTRQCFGNICVMRKGLFDSYSEWLFKVLFELERRIEIPADKEQARVFGYLSERLIMVWLAWAKDHLAANPWFARAMPTGTFKASEASAGIGIPPRERVDDPILSVIVPVYNVEKYLAQCLRSVCTQCVERIEIICVDDGSTDSSPEILDRFAAIDRRIAVIRQVNRGLSAARNAGLEKARGKYIAFVDSDDWVERLAWYRSIRKIERDDLDFLIFDEQAVDDDTGHLIANKWNLTRFDDKCYRRPFVWREIGRSPFDSPCFAHNKVIRRSFWGERRFPEGMLYEDAPVHIDLMLSARKIGALACPFYFYRCRGGSIMAKNGEMVLDHLKIIPLAWKRMTELGLQRELADDFANYAQDLAIRCMTLWPARECRHAVASWLRKNMPLLESYPFSRVHKMRIRLLADGSALCKTLFLPMWFLTHAVNRLKAAVHTLKVLCQRHVRHG